MNLTQAKHRALALANKTGSIYAVVVTRGVETGLLGNTDDCEVVPYPAPGDRIVMANIGPGAMLR